MKTRLLFGALLLTSCFSVAQTTPILDPIFEQALVDQGKDTNGLNGNILNTDAQAVTFLNVQALGISFLTGIEAFSSLQVLICNSNSLTTLDLSQNIALLSLDISNNQLTSINIDANISLGNLNCSSNQITSLDLSQNLSLLTLVCSSNPLTNLDVTILPDLDTIACAGNGLNSLDLTQNTMLSGVICSYNNFTNLDFSQNNLLQNIDCSNNKITTLDLSFNPALFNFNCISNELTSLDLRNGTNSSVPNTNFKFAGNLNLTCINVDDATYSTDTWTAFLDPQMYFSENCSLGIDVFDATGFIVYPNPINDNLFLKGQSNIQSVIVYNMLGQEIKRMTPNTLETEVNMTALSQGAYIVKVSINDVSQTIRIIKK